MSHLAPVSPIDVCISHVGQWSPTQTGTMLAVASVLCIEGQSVCRRLKLLYYAMLPVLDNRNFSKNHDSETNNSPITIMTSVDRNWMGDHRRF